MAPEERIAALQDKNMEPRAQADALEQTCAELRSAVLELEDEDACLSEVIEGPGGELGSAEQRKLGRPSFVQPKRVRRDGRGLAFSPSQGIIRGGDRAEDKPQADARRMHSSARSRPPKC